MKRRYNDRYLLSILIEKIVLFCLNISHNINLKKRLFLKIIITFKIIISGQCLLMILDKIYTLKFNYTVS